MPRHGFDIMNKTTITRLYIGLHVSPANLERLPQDLLTAYKNMRDIQGRAKANEYLNLKMLRTLKLQLVKHLTGFSILHSEGFWEGNYEQSVVVEIIDSGADLELLCNDIKKSCYQDSILVTIQSVDTYNF